MEIPELSENARKALHEDLRELRERQRDANSKFLRRIEAIGLKRKGREIPDAFKFGSRGL